MCFAGNANYEYIKRREIPWYFQHEFAEALHRKEVSMRNYLSRVLILLTVIVLSSCTTLIDLLKINPLSIANNEIHNTFTEEDLKTVQFYVSDDIVFNRELSIDAAPAIEGHEIVYKNNVDTDTFSVDAKTPGILYGIYRGTGKQSGRLWYFIQFEEGWFLEFTYVPDIDRFVLVEDDKGVTPYHSIDSEGDPLSNALDYEVTYPSGLRSGSSPYLLVSIKKIENKEKSVRKLKGIKLE